MLCAADTVTPRKGDEQGVLCPLLSQFLLHHANVLPASLPALPGVQPTEAAVRALWSSLAGLSLHQGETVAGVPEIKQGDMVALT